MNNDINWQTPPDSDYQDILYHQAEGIAKITINRPQVRNAFRPETVQELSHAFRRAHLDPQIGVIILTGAGDLAFCSGGDQKIRGAGGYRDSQGVEHLNVLELQRQIRTLPKPVVAMVAGYAIGGGHVLHLICDLSIAADNARFGQTGPKVGSFDAGLGAGLLARTVGLKKAKEIWFLCRQYDAQQALEMGLVNTVVPLAELERETVNWCREMLVHSPTALRVLKSAFNADTDGLAGIQELAGNATALFYLTDEAQEGRNAFVEKRAPDFSKFPAPAMKAAQTVQHWLLAIRPKTLSLSLVPVIVGITLAWQRNSAVRAAAGARGPAGALLIQIGTNLHNDAEDFARGTDTAERLGPPRATAQGWLSSTAVMRGAYIGLRPGLPDRPLSGVARRLADLGHRPDLAAGRLRLHRRPQTHRLQRQRRTLRVSVLRPGGGARQLLSANP